MQVGVVCRVEGWKHAAKLPFRREGQIRCFSDRVKLKEFIIAKPLLYEMLKGLI